MKKTIVLLALTSAFSASAAPARPTIAVTEFRQEVHHFYDGCKGYWWRTQDQLKTVLEKALSDVGFRVVERQHIGKLHDDEFKMENLNPETKAPEKKFRAAKYAVTGGITELGICEEEEDNGINLGGIVSLLGGPSANVDVKFGGAVSKVKLVAKLVSVETGEVIKAFESETESKDGNFGVRASAMGIGGRRETAKMPPIERATNEGLQKLAREIADYLGQN